MNCFWPMWRDDSGQDIAEYAFLLFVVLVFAVAAVSSLANNASNIFIETANKLR